MQDLESDTIGHIDSPETSDALHGESLMDDISSLLGQDMLGALQDNTITEDTTTLCALDRPRKKSFKKKLLAPAVEDKEPIPQQCGFENRVFDMGKTLDQQRYASLAQFVEGSDIARKSFKVEPLPELTVYLILTVMLFPAQGIVFEGLLNSSGQTRLLRDAPD